MVPILSPLGGGGLGCVGDAPSPQPLMVMVTPLSMARIERSVNSRRSMPSFVTPSIVSSSSMGLPLAVRPALIELPRNVEADEPIVRAQPPARHLGGCRPEVVRDVDLERVPAHPPLEGEGGQERA